MKRTIKGLIILIIGLSLNGCIVAAVGAGVGAWKWGSSKQKEAQAKNQDSYNQYVLGMEKNNLEREKAHLQPEPILSYPAYLKADHLK